MLRGAVIREMRENRQIRSKTHLDCYVCICLDLNLQQINPLEATLKPYLNHETQI